MLYYLIRIIKRLLGIYLLQKHSYLDSITAYWLNNPQLWFNAKSDENKKLFEKFNLPTQLENQELIPNVGFIILNDQITRNLRNEGFILDFKQHYSQAYTIAIKIFYSIEYYDVPLEQKIFIWLCLRHNDIEKHYEELVKECLYNYKTNPQLIKRFYSAMCTQYAKEKKYLRKNPLADYFDLTPVISVYSPSFPTIISKHTPIIDLNKYNFKSICISLSGGVDSMVLLYHFYQKYLNNELLDLCVVHINYNNRGYYSEIEEDLVRQICTKMGLKYYIYSIREIKRNDAMKLGCRELYEDLTKEIRFYTYKNTGADYVVLGHNFDDIIENIFSNIKNCKPLENIKGMKEEDIINGCNIIRPLLSVKKNDIINFSLKYRVPFIHNTTPKWSNRGKFRNEFIPALHKQYGDTIEEKIYDFANKVEEIAAFPIEKNICIDKLENNYICEKYLRQICPSISQKSIKNFREMLKSAIKKEKTTFKIVLKKELLTFQIENHSLSFSNT